MAKINHDLRNMLTSAKIASERLAMMGDPRVTQALPRLERALDRAVTLASDVLNYGKTSEAAPRPVTTPLLAAVQAAAEDAGLTEDGVRLETDIAPDASVHADTDQRHRILVNLLRNAREAVQSAESDATGEVRVTLETQGETGVIRVADTGPGLPERAVASLFQPFAGSGRAGGAGLGLAISREWPGARRRSGAGEDGSAGRGVRAAPARRTGGGGTARPGWRTRRDLQSRRAA